MSELVRYDAACRALAEAKSVDEVKDMRDKAEAMRAYARQAKNKTLEIDAAEIRFRAERRIGEMMSAQRDAGDLNNGGRPTKTGSRTDPVIEAPTLAAVGIDKHLADRARKLAAVSDEKFESITGEWRERVQKENERVTVSLLKASAEEERRKDVSELASMLGSSTARYDLYNEPCLSALEKDAGTVDWVITDPPYPKEFLHVYDELGQASAYALKPGGSLLCMVGHSYLPDVITSLGRHLTYHWTIAYLTPGGQATQIWPRKVNTFWKPVLWFVKGEFTGDWIGDVTRSTVNDNDKRFHQWGQSESGMRDLMARFVKPGDTVLDPFMGAGTTGVVAMDLGARFFGLDVSLDAYNEAVVRLDSASLVI